MFHVIHTRNLADPLPIPEHYQGVNPNAAVVASGKTAIDAAMAFYNNFCETHSKPNRPTPEKAVILAVQIWDNLRQNKPFEGDDEKWEIKEV